MTSNNPLEPDELANLSANERDVADKLSQLTVDQLPEPFSEFRRTVLQRAIELDTSKSSSTRKPVDQRSWLSRHPKAATAAVLSVAAGLLIWVALSPNQDRNRHDVAKIMEPKPDQWIGFHEGNPPDKHLPKTEPVKLDLKSANDEEVFGNRSGLSEAQNAFGAWVKQNAYLSPRITIDGKEYELNEDPSKSLYEDKPETGWSLEGANFTTRTRHTKVLAQQHANTLNDVQNSNIYVGALIDGQEYMRNGSIVSVRSRADDKTFARQRLTIIGPPLGVEGAIDKKKADATARAERRVDLTDGKGIDFDPISRADYDRARKSLLDQVGMASYYSVEVDTASCLGEFEFKAGIHVSGDFGSLKASFENKSQEEHATVFARGTEVAYTVALTGDVKAALWVEREADVRDLIEGKSPLMVIDEVVYGRSWVIVSHSDLTTDEMRTAFNGEINTMMAKYEGNALLEKKKQLAATNIKVFNLGGEANRKVFQYDLTKLQSVPALIHELQQPAITKATAYPIAYHTKWLATGKPAGWVGVVPMQIYTKPSNSPVKFDVVLTNFNVRRRFGDVLFLGGGGDFNLGARVGGIHDGDGHSHYFYGAGLEKRPHDYNHPLLSEADAPAPCFRIAFRQRNRREPITTWDDFKGAGDDSSGEDSTEVCLQNMLAKTKEKGAKVEEELPRLRFPGNNEATVKIIIRTPPVAPMPDAKPLPDVGKTEKRD